MNSLANTEQPLTIAYGASYANSEVWNAIKSKTISPIEIVSASAALRYNPALILLDHRLIREMELEKWVKKFPESIFLCTESMGLDVDLLLSNSLPYVQTAKILEMACYQWILKTEQAQKARMRDTSVKYLNKLVDISISLSAEDELLTLLRKILSEGQNIACCDAASLFLINEINDHEKELVFKLTQNDSMDFPFEEISFPLDGRSIAGYVALSNSELNIEDVYDIPTDVTYQFNRSFDNKTGYRTKSTFTIPLINKQKSVIGVLQFINRKKARSLKITDEKSANVYTLPFDSDINILLRALASQAGIAIENTILQNDIKNLFEGFVNASVHAIEQRDPTTSGHSFRVADLCVDLANSVSVSNLTRLKNVRFTDPEIKELKYAALLHDFGKVGVREAVLVKEKKLGAGTLNSIHYRILLAQERLKSQSLTNQLDLYKRGQPSDSEITSLQAQLQQDTLTLQKFYESIVEVNEPTMLNEDNRHMLDRISEYRFGSPEDELSIITPDEFDLLSISKGSLSPVERKEIESHVVHTQNFLNHIPWTKEFQNIPTIAAAHHEKLDGSGYPYGMTEDEIPLCSKIMTICDIYDALTASDRPYKPAMNTERAIDILVSESKRSLLDNDLVQIFIDAKVFHVIDSTRYPQAAGVSSTGNHPCEPDLHAHD